MWIVFYLGVVTPRSSPTLTFPWNYTFTAYLDSFFSWQIFFQIPFPFQSPATSMWSWGGSPVRGWRVTQESPPSCAPGKLWCEYTVPDTPFEFLSKQQERGQYSSPNVPGNYIIKSAGFLLDKEVPNPSRALFLAAWWEDSRSFSQDPDGYHLGEREQNFLLKPSSTAPSLTPEPSSITQGARADWV